VSRRARKWNHARLAQRLHLTMLRANRVVFSQTYIKMSGDVRDLISQRSRPKSKNWKKVLKTALSLLKSHTLFSLHNLSDLKQIGSSIQINQNTGQVEKRTLNLKDISGGRLQTSRNLGKKPTRRHGKIKRRRNIPTSPATELAKRWNRFASKTLH